MDPIRLNLSHPESKICSGVCLTYGYVPFHRVEKLRTTPEDLMHLDQLFHRFVQKRGESPDVPARGPGGSRVSPLAVEMTLSDDDLQLLIDVFETTLQEHQPSSKHSDDNLELHVGTRGEVEAALAKLRSLQRQPHAV